MYKLAPSQYDFLIKFDENGKRLNTYSLFMHYGVDENGRPKDGQVKIQKCLDEGYVFVDGNTYAQILAGNECGELRRQPDGTYGEYHWTDDEMIQQNLEYIRYEFDSQGDTLKRALANAQMFDDDESIEQIRAEYRALTRAYLQARYDLGDIPFNEMGEPPVKNPADLIIPVGTIRMLAGGGVPEGWLVCDGSAISRTDYAALFAVLGTIWGEGDGSTTFNLPHTILRFPEGHWRAGGYINAGLPNIYGEFHMNAVPGDTSTSGSIYRIYANYVDHANHTAGPGVDALWAFNAKTSSDMYGRCATVQPEAFLVRYIIRY